MGTSSLLADSPGNSCGSIAPKGWSLGRSRPLPGVVVRSCSAWSRGACPSPEWFSLPEPQSVGPQGATLPWGRPEDPGLQEVPALCFCQLGLPALPAKWPVQRGHFLASDATRFCGNAGGLKCPLFPQDNRSLVPLTMPFSFPECTQSQHGPCPAGHLSASGTCARKCLGRPAFPTFFWAVAGGPRPVSASPVLTG